MKTQYLTTSCQITFYLTISMKLLVESQQATSNNVEYCSKTDEKKTQENCQQKIRTRYILYNVNPGEGFNLRRDIFVRIAPLIASLNAKNLENKWVLVLPVWAQLPHWATSKLYSWSTFFQLDKINEYIPAIEFEDFMDEYGYHERIDAVFQLQHFPFNENEAWKEKMEFDVNCVDPFLFQLDENSGLYFTNLWNHRIFVKKAQCMALRGTASTLLDFLQNSCYMSVLLERAEVILWDSYGDEHFWAARKSLQFLTKLTDIAKSFVQSNFPDFNIQYGNSGVDPAIITGNSYIAIHLRRRDFTKWKSQEHVPSMQNIADQVFKIMEKLNVWSVFMATDAFKSEIKEFQSELIQLTSQIQNSVPLLIQYTSMDVSEGEIAIIDQIICSWSTYFIGTKDSTFTTRIFEERELLSCFEPGTTFNAFCPNSISKCEQPIRWRIKS